MDENEFKDGIDRHGLTMTDLCSMMEIKTGSIIAPKHIRTAFDKYGTLSHPMSAAIRLLFQVMDHERKTYR